MAKIIAVGSSSMKVEEDLYQRLIDEANDTLNKEPELKSLLKKTVLADDVTSFNEAVASTVAYRLLPSQNQDDSCFCPNTLRGIISTAMNEDGGSGNGNVDRNDDGDDNSDESVLIEHGHFMSSAVRADALAVIERDPACKTILEVVLFYKGFSSLVTHRAARRLWLSGKTMTALFLQSQCSSQFGVDIHPAATIGAGILIDHATGIVVGETAWIGDGCTLLHGVTLGGTGKEIGDRHPKVGHQVLIGAGASLLGNIVVGNSCKIGAGSICLRNIPSGATAVGAPAKIVGRAESNPAELMDTSLEHIQLLHKSTSLATMTTAASTINIENLKNNCDGSTSVNGSSISLSSSSISDQSQNEASRLLSKDDFCGISPYRAYVRMSKIAPPASFTICSLFKLLRSENIPCDVIGSVFFALDTRDVGYVDVTPENCSRLLQIIEKEMACAQRTQSETASTIWNIERISKVIEAFRLKFNPP